MVARLALLLACLAACGPGSYYQRSWAAYEAEHGNCEKLCRRYWSGRVDRANRFDSTTCLCIHEPDPIESLEPWLPDMYATLTCSRSCDHWENPGHTALLGRQSMRIQVHRSPPPGRGGSR